MTSVRPTVREFEGDMIVATADLVADAVMSLVLVDPDGDQLPPWTPGAHVDLILESGLVRQYSLCGQPIDSRTIRLGVLRQPEGRGGSAYVHDKLQPGAKVRVRGPRNHFPFVSAKRYIFIAGGIGITPLLPMIAQASASGAEWRLLYRGRSRTAMGFLADLAQYGEHVELLPKDEGSVLDLVEVLRVPSPDTLIYVCGPERLLAGAEAAATHWPTGALHVERFQAKPSELTEREEREFDIVLAASGMTLRVPPDKSIFEVVEDAGVSVLGSCHEGICGTCEQIVLDGAVDHRDSVLSEAERATNEMMMICVSRCLSDRLTLDM